MTMDKQDTYITYKQAFISGIAIIGILLVVIGLVTGVLSKSLDTKVSSEVYTLSQKALSEDISEIKANLAENTKQLHNIELTLSKGTR